VQLAFNWKRLSVIAGITMWTFYFRLYLGTIKSPQIVDFLRHLRRQSPRKLLIIWDGLEAHRRWLVQRYIDASGGDSADVSAGLCAGTEPVGVYLGLLQGT
jgi:hypothetical protein